MTVTDSVNDPNATCVVTGGIGATIAASPPYPGALVTATFPFTCTYPAPPARVNEVDTATATWDFNTNVPNDSYQYTQPFRTRPKITPPGRYGRALYSAGSGTTSFMPAS